MPQNKGSIKPILTWVDRGMVFYLQWVVPNTMYNTLVAKVYHQDGEIRHSIRNLPPDVNLYDVEREIEGCKEVLAEKIAKYAARRLDNALQGEN